MTRRTDRVDSLLRRTLGELLLTKMADPRLDPARTSITAVEVSEDLLRAKVYVSVLGTEAEQRTALRALRHASGHLQEMMSHRIRLRNMPVLTFVLDEKYKRTMETLSLIDKAMDEFGGPASESPCLGAEAPRDDGAAAAGEEP